MSSAIGNRLQLSVFGESHGQAIGCVLQGLPAGESLNMEEIQAQMARRAPGRDALSTPRQEGDIPRILSGMRNGRTTGAPLAVCMENQDQQSREYGAGGLRPGHADYTAHVRYGGYNDERGGGHGSGRLTAPLVFAGAVCRQILRRRGVTIGGHILRMAGQEDIPFDPVRVSVPTLEALSVQPFPLLDPTRETAMRRQTEAARLEADSVGGIVEIAAVGVPPGWGSPLFGGVENVLSALLFGIPAVKGVSFGDGFAFADLRGSTANDAFAYDEQGKVVTVTNHNGGILGGITNGMPVLARVVLKPTPSIGKAQQTIDLRTGQSVTLVIKGRHDACIVPRALPAVEAAMAIGLLDLAMERQG